MTAFMLLLCCIIDIGNTSIINPTITNITGEYYISSQSVTTFYNNNIQCTSSTCIIICDMDYSQGCYRTNINSSLSNNLIISCLNYRSCQYLQIINGPIDLF